MEPPRPRLPCEVIERIISHAGDHPKTLCSFALTCHQLCPRALCLMVGRATFGEGSNHTFSFVDLLEAKPHLKPLVRSIVVDPMEFAPFPLLHILPNLSEIEFREWRLCPNSVTLHPSSLVCCQRFGTQIQTLHLSGLSFPTYLSFVRMLLAFTNLRHLTCTNIVLEKLGGGAPLRLLKRRLSEQMKLKSLTYLSPVSGETASVRPLLFSPGLAPSTVENLIIATKIGVDAFSRLYGWSRLRLLVLRVHNGGRAVTAVVKLLESFGSPELREVVLELEPTTSIPTVLKDLSFDAHGRPGRDILKELEDRLLRFPHFSMTWVSSMRRHSFWVHELSRRFPVLCQRGGLTLKSGSQSASPPGHDGAIHALAVSPDSTWVASGSGDFTIILWDANGDIALQWIPHGYHPVRSLSFSPNSRYLVSCGGHEKLVVWEPSADARQVAVLEGHSALVVSCSWSPDGNLIASRSLDATVRLWDAHTFRDIRVFDEWPMQTAPSGFFAWSPDERCLAGGSSSGIYCVRDVPRVMLRKSVRAESPDDCNDHPPESDPGTRHDCGSTRLAASSGPDVSNIWNISSEKGERLFALEQLHRVYNLSFSPDGRLLVAAVENLNGPVTVWDAHLGVELAILEGHKYGVTSVCFSPCGKYLASASLDETVRLWRSGDWLCVAMCSEPRHAVTLRVTFSPDGNLLLSGAKDGTIVIQKVKDLVPVDI